MSHYIQKNLKELNEIAMAGWKFLLDVLVGVAT